jgi:metallo-beta-lactamase class B
LPYGRIVEVKPGAAGLLLSAAFIGGPSVAPASAPPRDDVSVHVARARAAAGSEYQELFGLCDAPEPILVPPTSPTPSPRPFVPPPRSEWYAEPVKVFDNLYFVGQTEYSAWAVTTSAGIILIDALWDYSVQDEVVGGLEKLGLDPSAIKYVLVSHGHADHAGGASYLQSRFGAHVILSAADWDLLAHDTGGWPKPRRDLTATDGEKLTLGDTTLTLYLTPGHTPGTISTLIPLRESGQRHLAAEWGGTGFNFTITADKPRKYWFETYRRSAERFRAIAARAGADVILSNHTYLDGSTTKLPALARRRPGDPHPYVVGTASVERYLTVAEECARAGLLRLH